MPQSHSHPADDTGVKTLPAITCAFSDYKPPRALVPVIRRMLDSVPERFLRGLGEVVLTDTGALSRRRRRDVTRSRGKKVHVPETRGLYHPAYQNHAAWVEIFVDNTLRRSSRGVWRLFPIIRNWELEEILFHEIGHHIHFAVRPEFREKEDVADVWKVRLSREYNGRHFRWTRRIVRLFWPIIGKWVNRWHKEGATVMLEKGAISRAEYDESVDKTKPTNEPSRP